MTNEAAVKKLSRTRYHAISLSLSSSRIPRRMELILTENWRGRENFIVRVVHIKFQATLQAVLYTPIRRMSNKSRFDQKPISVYQSVVREFCRAVVIRSVCVVPILNTRTMEQKLDNHKLSNSFHRHAGIRKWDESVVTLSYRRCLFRFFPE